jgi:predicted nucleic acid-binding Zn ribbon protein
MPIYTYRREDDTTFEFQQDSGSDALTFCPTTGQKVVRLFQSKEIVLKGSGSLVNNSRKVPNRKLNGKGKDNYMRLKIADSSQRSRGKKI